MRYILLELYGQPPWWLRIALVFVPPVAFPVPLVAGILWAAFAYSLVRRWSSGVGWKDTHRWALASSAILVCMLGGFLGSSTWPRMDLFGKVVLNVIAVICLAVLGIKVRGRVRGAD